MKQRTLPSSMAAPPCGGKIDQSAVIALSYHIRKNLSIHQSIFHCQDTGSCKTFLFICNIKSAGSLSEIPTSYPRSGLPAERLQPGNILFVRAGICTPHSTVSLKCQHSFSDDSSALQFSVYYCKYQRSVSTALPQ